MNKSLRLLPYFHQKGHVIRQLHLSAGSCGRFVYYNIHRRSQNPRHQDENHFEHEALKLDVDSPQYLDKLCDLWTEKMSVQHDLIFKKGAAKNRGVFPDKFKWWF